MPVDMARQKARGPHSFRGLRVGVVGMGIEGQDAVRFLHAEGAAEIIVSERRPLAQIEKQRAALSAIPYRLEAGGNDAALAERIDALFVSQSVPDELALVQAARARGIPVTAMMRLFLQRCPSPIIGITGSAGKSTTTALVGEMLHAAERPAFVGGNIGIGLLAELPKLGPTTTVILEISHTQLAQTDRSPRLAAVLNITPNHLDQFTWDAYVDLKRNLVRYQRTTDQVVLPSENATARALHADTLAQAFFFGVRDLPGPGASVRNQQIVWNDGASEQPVAPLEAIQLRGAHNVQNVLAAAAIGGAWGLPPAAMARAIEGFRGLAHRLEEIGAVGDVRYVNDSIATTPERTLAALRAHDAPVIVLLGGREKQLPLDDLVHATAQRARAVICFGEAGTLFAAAMRKGWTGRADVPVLREVETLSAAVSAAQDLAQAGDVVLLSPAGTSFDAYTNFAERGRHFTSLVHGLACEHGDREEGHRGTC